MKRWAICKMGDYENTGETVPKFNVYGIERANIYSKTGFTWCFGQFSMQDLTAISADPDVYILPDATMDLAVGSIPSGVRNTMKSKLEAAGFSFAGVNTNWTVRELLNFIGKQLDAAADVESNDIPDVTV